MFDYTTVDFETANSYRGSPCAVGVVKVRNGVPVDQERWLIRPPEAVDYFDGFNVALHGITPEMVRVAPRWRRILPRLLAYVGEDVVVAHNAGFDIGVIRYACAADGIAWPSVRFLCTLVLSRRALSLPSYRLPFVLHEFGVEFDGHHDALADAKAVVTIISHLSRLEGVSDINSLAESIHV